MKRVMIGLMLVGALSAQAGVLKQLGNGAKAGVKVVVKDTKAVAKAVFKGMY